MASALRKPSLSAFPDPRPAAPRGAAAPKIRHLVPVPKPVPAPAAAARRDRKALGIGAILACCALFSASDAAAKILTGSLPSLEVAWFRYLVFVLVTAPMALRGRAVLVTPRFRLQAWRACAAALSTATAITGFGLMPVAESTAIGFLAPVIVTVMAAFLLRERVAPHRWAAALVGLVGVLIIVEPGTAAFKLASLIPLVGSVLSAGSSVATRLVREERADTTLFYAAAIGFAILSVPVLFVWRAPGWGDVGVGAVVGLFAAAASLAQVVAYRHAPASLLQPFTYSQLLWASGFGFLLFGAVPGTATVLGVAVIAAGGLYTAWRESRGAAPALRLGRAAA